MAWLIFRIDFRYEIQRISLPFAIFLVVGTISNKYFRLLLLNFGLVTDFYLIQQTFPKGCQRNKTGFMVSRRYLALQITF